MRQLFSDTEQIDWLLLTEVEICTSESGTGNIKLNTVPYSQWRIQLGAQGAQAPP